MGAKDAGIDEFSLDGEPAGGGVAVPMPTTLAMLLAEFIKQYAKENLAPKTVERYFEMAPYLV